MSQEEELQARRALLALLGRSGGRITVTTEELRQRLRTDDLAGLLFRARAEGRLLYSAAGGQVFVALDRQTEHR